MWQLGSGHSMLMCSGDSREMASSREAQSDR